MRVLIDTNVILDVLLKREPFYGHSQLVLLAAEEQYIHGYVSASAITDIFYVTQKSCKSKNEACALITSLVKTISIGAVDSDIIMEALDAGWDDFEDCVQYAVGEDLDVDYIITRNPRDFSNGRIEAISPEELLNIVMPD